VALQRSARLQARLVNEEGDMASLASSAQLPSLSTHERDEVGRELQAVLVDLVDLSLLGKQLHWTVVGPHFRSLHLQLDDLVYSWRALGDTVAERAVALGVMPDGQSGAVAETSEIAPVERRPLEDHTVVRELTHRLAEVSDRVRSRLERVGELDLASQDVLIEVLRALEEQQWMLRAQLGAGA
jgi:starvation-inducible DNA-binding protein